MITRLTRASLLIPIIGDGRATNSSRGRNTKVAVTGTMVIVDLSDWFKGELRRFLAVARRSQPAP
jgi:hypothetical protein